MKHFKFPLYLLFAALSVNGFVACNEGDDDDPSVEKENVLSPAIAQYVNNTVVATYRSLADASIDLYDALKALKENKTEANLKAATKAWITSRDYWERSEAFLFGAVADFGIDPHIDTWPLDEVTFNQTISHDDYIHSMDAEDGDVWAADHLGFALLGFHGIEYILFRNGEPKQVNTITEKEMIYAVAVAGDLRNQCVRLEASWAGIDKVTTAKQALIDAAGLSVTPSNSPLSYGENMLTAGKAGSAYRTITDAAVAMIAGCIDISDEVGEVKIGTAYSKDNVHYIESPYSYNSKVDFIGNIISIQNVYLGGADAGKRGASLSNYIKSVDSELDREIQVLISNAILTIDAIPYPFAKNYASGEAGKALEACQELTAALEKVREVLIK